VRDDPATVPYPPEEPNMKFHPNKLGINVPDNNGVPTEIFRCFRCLRYHEGRCDGTGRRPEKEKVE